MIKDKKFSLTLLNSILLLIFLLFIIIGISASVYFTTQKVIDYNINEYFKQTNNVTSIILENEQKHLNDVTFEISKIIQENQNDIESKINNITAVDQIDILFLRDGKNIENFSNSLFDTELIIKELEDIQISLDNTILSMNIENEFFLLLLSTKKILDEKTGRVSSVLYSGKILNDNFSLVNSIKQKAFLEEVFIYFDNNLIATTSHDLIVDSSIFKDNSIVKKNDFIYFHKNINIHDNKQMEIVFLSKNATFNLMEEDFKKIGYILFIFILLSFIVLYIASNRYIIRPFSKLLSFAKKAKDNEDVPYEKTNVLEFDNFAINLKSIIDELRELKEQYSRAIEGVQDGLWDLDLKTNQLYCSKRYLLMLGYSSSEKITDINFWRNSIHKDDYLKTLRKLAKHYKKMTDLYEDNYRILCKDGSYKWIKIRGKIFYDENNNAVRITGFHTDIDDIIRLENDNMKKEQMLYQQSKLASMGEMIGNIAHQWRQPLNVISTIASAQIMQLELGISNKNETTRDLNKLIDTVQYLSKIIEKFRNFFNPNKELEYFYIDNLVKDNLEIFESSYKSNAINLIIDLDHIELEGYKFELMQVLINIINNARDALLDKYDIDESKYIFLKSVVNNKKLEIIIYDNAGGIKKSLKEKIYEPYFTTKHQSQGTGLGLYMSSEIIKKHFKGELKNDTITFKYENNEYTGEEFRVILPL